MTYNQLERTSIIEEILTRFKCQFPQNHLEISFFSPWTNKEIQIFTHIWSCKWSLLLYLQMQHKTHSRDSVQNKAFSQKLKIPEIWRQLKTIASKPLYFLKLNKWRVRGKLLLKIFSLQFIQCKNLAFLIKSYSNNKKSPIHTIDTVHELKVTQVKWNK